MITFIVVIVCVLAVILWFKYKLAKNKKPEDRSAVETILVSQGVKGRKSLEEAAGQIRTAEISKEEGIQRTKDAIAQLDADYKTEMKNMILHQSKLSEKLNNSFKLEPGKLEAKARSSKKKMEEAQAAGKAAVAEAHKKNALMYLSQKSKALERIAKTEKTLQDLEVNIELASAAYEGRKGVLQEYLMDFEAMTTAISAAKFNESMEQIQALRRETVDKLTAQNAEIEADNRISGLSDPGNVSNVDTAAFEDEFNNL